MKKILVTILFLVSLITPSAANTNGETLRLSATVTNVVYIGVSKKALTSSIVPTDTINNIGFAFNVNTGKWETHEAYIYIISFVSNALKVQLKSDTTSLALTDSSKSGPATLSYTATVTPMSSGAGGTMSDVSLPNTSLQTIYLESGTFDYPRVKCWKFNAVINPSSYTGKDYIPSGNEYSGSFTLQISTVS